MFLKISRAFLQLAAKANGSILKVLVDLLKYARDGALAKERKILSTCSHPPPNQVSFVGTYNVMSNRIEAFYCSFLSFFLIKKKQKIKKKICFLAPFVSYSFAIWATPLHKTQGNGSLCQATNSRHRRPAFSSWPKIYKKGRFCHLPFSLIRVTLFENNPHHIQFPLFLHLKVVLIFHSNDQICSQPRAFHI